MTDKPTPITEDAERELRAERVALDAMSFGDSWKLAALRHNSNLSRAFPALLAALDEARARADRAEAALDRRRSTFDDSPLFGDKGSAAGQHRERGE